LSKSTFADTEPVAATVPTSVPTRRAEKMEFSEALKGSVKVTVEGDCEEV